MVDRCPVCHAPVSPRAQFCGACGSPHVLVCARCQADNSLASRYCAVCGTSLADVMTALMFHTLIKEPRQARLAAVKWVGAIASFVLFALLVIVLRLSVPDRTALELATLAAIMPAIFYSILVLHLDRYEREPLRTVVVAFAWGAVGAVLVALLLELGIGALIYEVAFSRTGSVHYANLVSDFDGSVFVAPAVEETCKGIGVLGVFFLFRDEFDNVLDGLVYAALIALGFAMTENILYYGQAYMQAGQEGLPGVAGLSISFFLRSVLGGFGHPFYTGCTGAALGWYRSHRGGHLRMLIPVAGFALAVAFHATWNFEVSSLRNLGGYLALVVLFLVPGVLVLYVIARVARGRELEVIRHEMLDEVGRGTITQQEYDILTDPRARKIALHMARVRGGRSLRRAQDRFFQAAANLAYRKYHVRQGEEPHGGAASDDALRMQLAALRLRLSTTVPAPRAAAP